MTKYELTLNFIKEFTSNQLNVSEETTWEDFLLSLSWFSKLNNPPQLFLEEANFFSKCERVTPHQWLVNKIETCNFFMSLQKKSEIEEIAASSAFSN